MAKFTGFSCDATRCKTTAEGDTLPIGWVRVKPVVDPKNEPKPEEELQVCSNKCLMDIGKERYRAAVDAGEESPRGRMTDKGKGKGKGNAQDTA